MVWPEEISLEIFPSWFCLNPIPFWKNVLRVVNLGMESVPPQHSPGFDGWTAMNFKQYTPRN